MLNGHRRHSTRQNELARHSSIWLSLAGRLGRVGVWGREVVIMSEVGRFVYRWKRMSSHYARSGGLSAIVYARQRFIMRPVYPDGFQIYDTLRSKYRNIGSSKLLIIPQFSRIAFSTRRSNPDMRQCNTIEDLVRLAYDHLDTISPRGIAAFW